MAELVERVDLLGRARQLEHDGVGADVEQPSAERLRGRDELGAALGRHLDADDEQLALDRLAGDELRHPQHVDELVDLLLDLLERVLGAVDAEGDAGDARTLCRPDRERLDVEAASREHRRDARERPGAVLDHHGQRVLHDDIASSTDSSYSSMSSAAAPAGIIGKHCSAGSTRQSTTTVRPRASASSSAGSSSASVVTTIPTPP